MLFYTLLTRPWFWQSAAKWEEESDKSKVGNSRINVLILCCNFVQDVFTRLFAVCAMLHEKIARHLWYVQSDRANELKQLMHAGKSVLLTLGRISSQNSTNVANLQISTTSSISKRDKRSWVYKAVNYFDFYVFFKKSGSCRALWRGWQKFSKVRALWSCFSP